MRTRGTRWKATAAVVVVATVLAPAALAGGGDSTVESKSFSVPGASVAGKTAKCPRGAQATGGGSSYTPLGTGENSWRVHSTFPSGARTWTAEMANHSGAEHEAKVFVACLKGDELGRVSQPEAVNGSVSSQTATSVECPTGSSATGGGGYMSGGYSQMHALVSRPEGKRAWQFETYAAGGYIGTQEAYVVCDPKNSHDYTTVVDTTSTPARSGARRGTVLTVEAKAKCPQDAVATGGGYSWGAGDVNPAVFNNRPKGARTWLLSARTYYPHLGFTAYARCLE